MSVTVNNSPLQDHTKPCLQVELKFFHEHEVRDVDFLFSVAKVSERPGVQLAAGDVILARTICVPFASVAMYVCRHEQQFLVTFHDA